MAAPSKTPQGEEASVPEALEHIVTSLADVVDKRVDLLQLDARAFASRVSQAGTMLAVGGFFTAIAWAALMGLTYVALETQTSPAAATGVIVALNALFGIALLVLGRRQLGLSKRSS